MSPRPSRRTRTFALAAIGVFALAACGGSSGGGDEGAGDGARALPAVEVPDAVEVLPVADVATNLLPDLVVDDINDDNKVNLRNYGVGDKPILLWMWAPH